MATATFQKMSGFTAAYPLDPKQLAKGQTPQCCGSTDFCFLCEYSCGSTPGDADVVGEMNGVARGMAEQGKDVHVIANALLELYESSAKDIVQWVAPNGVMVQSPVWTKAAITRHILFSTELGVFGNAVGQILHSVIYNLNNTLLDTKTGMVVEDHRRALMDTIKTAAAWRTAQNTSSAPPRKRRKADA